MESLYKLIEEKGVKNLIKDSRNIPCPECGKGYVQYLIETPINNSPIWSGRCESCLKHKKEIESKKNSYNNVENEIIELFGKQIAERYEGKDFSNFIAEEKELLKIGYSKKDILDIQQALFQTKKITHEIIQGQGKRSLLLIGKNGTGKDHLAIAMYKQLKLNYINALIVDLPILFDKLWAGISNKKYDEAMNYLETVDLLILNEIGIQQNKDNEYIRLFRVLNERYKNNKPNVFITNLKWEQFVEVMGERIIDRFLEDGGKAVKFTWDSWRVLYEKSRKLA